MTDFSKKDENEVVLMAQAGDREATEFLIKKHKSICEAIAAKWSGSALDRDDLVQEGLIGLLSAVNSYKPGKSKAKFSTYCYSCVSHAVQDAVRATKRGKDIPREQIVPIEDYRLSTDDEYKGPEARYLASEKRDYIVKKIKEALSPREYEILSLHLDGYTYPQIGEMMGTGTKKIDNTIQKIKRVLRKQLSELLSDD